MTAALMLGAIALLVAPASGARRRLRRPVGDAGSAPRALRRSAPALAAAVAAALAFVEPTAGAAAGIVLATLVHRIRRGRRRRRRDDQTRSLLAGLEAAVADLRVGANPESACLGAAKESTGAASEAFRSAAATARLGGSAAQGLVAGAQRGRDAGIETDVERIAAAWRIAERHGIALADLLDATRSDLVARIRFRSRVESGLAGARATAAVLAGLPLLGVGLGQMTGAAPVRVLLSGGVGGTLLVVGTALACGGLAWADRITQRVSA
ncbi:type II secretion system F family protein [Rhodococcus sp. NPDC058505]|uniref:type II secretion system F family protein n=1 Tax=unclassified Rhodococcus (in: high G+C Gram-positive bacteria) TaxID=192944 RepID=UPI003659372B